MSTLLNSTTNITPVQSAVSIAPCHSAPGGYFGYFHHSVIFLRSLEPCQSPPPVSSKFPPEERCSTFHLQLSNRVFVTWIQAKSDGGSSRQTHEMRLKLFHVLFADLVSKKNKQCTKLNTSVLLGMLKYSTSQAWTCLNVRDDLFCPWKAGFFFNCQGF